MLTIANVLAASKAKQKLPALDATVIPSDPSEQPRFTNFGDLGWGSSCNAYLKSIKKLTNLTMDNIVTQAKTFARTTTGLQDDTTRGSYDPNDDRANLEEGSDGSEDE